MKLVDLVGIRFGRLLVLRRDATKKRHSMWFCKCDCGNSHIASLTSLKSGKTTSCGCFRNEVRSKTLITHGYQRKGILTPPEYRIWAGMKKRCYNSREDAYPHYGGKGIKVCDRWLTSFENFYNDMGPRPTKNHTLDRFPNKVGDYEPSNCRWATWEQQGKNRVNNRWIEHEGASMTLQDWSRFLRVSPGNLSRSLKKKTIGQIVAYYKR